MADFGWSADGAEPLLEFGEMSLLKSLLGHCWHLTPRTSVSIKKCFKFLLLWAHFCGLC